MDGPRWVAGSFLDNLDKISVGIGYQNLPLAFALARVNWPTPDDRDAFVSAITQTPNGG